VKVVAYIRVSTERQVREGYGLDAQRSDIKRWARAEGHRVVEWFADEGISGANGIESRVGLYDALAAVRGKTVDAIVITSLDRLARAMTQQEGVLAQVWASGGQVISLGDGGEVLEDDPDDPMRTAVRQMRGVFAQLGRGLIRQRMSKGKKAKAATGGYVGGAPPLGRRSERGKLVTDRTESKTVKLILKRHRDGLSLRQIITELEAAGLSPKRGGKWHPSTVARVIARSPSTSSS
jgi:DNA invertase Pin-like site-specific DNA recombinase